MILDATGPASAGYYLTGVAEGLPHEPVGVVVHGELVAAARYWRLLRTGGSGSAVRPPRRPAPAAFEPWSNDAVMVPQPSSPFRLTADDLAVPMEDGSWLDLLVFYTPEAKQDDAGGDAAIMELLVDLLILQTNAVYAESGVAHRLRLAAPPIEAEPFRETGFNSSSEMLQMLVDWERGRELRDNYAADLVTLLFSGRGLADAFSRAFINLPDRVTADEALPFSVTCPTCTRAFPHELGHNLGLRHDRYEWKQGETPDNLLIDVPHPEAFGFAGPFDGDPLTHCIITIMATGLECHEDGFWQVVRFSNPEREAFGVATGIPGTEPSGATDGPANAARHMNRMRRYAANWRRAPCLSGGSSVRLQASNGQYVGAVGNGGGAVMADQRRLGAHGLFTLVDHNGGPCVESGDSVSLETSDGFYLQAQLGGGAEVDATARETAPWTRFVVRRQLGSGALRAGDTLSLNTASGHWVAAARGGGGEVRADSEDGSRPWSHFKVAALWRDPPPRPNRPPAAVGSLPDRQLSPGAQLEVDVAGAFRDPDGDPLTYTAASSTPGAVTVKAGTGVTLTAVSEGMAAIQVTATDPGGLSAVQAFRVTVEQGVTVPFTDDPIVPGVTLVRAVHFTELRTRIDGLRTAVGLGRLAWTDPVLTAGATPVRLAHLLELRSALAAAYRAAGRAAPRWTDAAPVGGTTPIRARARDGVACRGAGAGVTLMRCRVRPSGFGSTAMSRSSWWRPARAATDRTEEGDRRDGAGDGRGGPADERRGGGGTEGAGAPRP